MAITVFGGQEKRGLFIGLSTDIKPIPPADNCCFLEINTGKIFYSSSAKWVENQRQETGTISFVNQKTKNILFNSPFTSLPNILFSNNAASPLVNYKTNVTSNGFTMNFQSNYSGTIDFVAKQNA